LIAAVHRGNLSVARFLVTMGADVHIQVIIVPLDVFATIPYFLV